MLLDARRSKSEGCVEAVPIGMDQLLLHPRRASASTKSVRVGAHVRDTLPFDERCHKPANLAAGGLGHLGKKGRDIIDWLTARVVGGRSEGFLTKGVCKDRSVQVISVTIQVATLRRRHRQVAR